MTEEITISFGDRVRVRVRPETEVVGMAGQIGEVRGVTTPSVTGIEVVGGSAEDCAYNVYVEELNREAWFSAACLEFVDHAFGTTITLDGVPKTWTRAATGDWAESQRRLSPREWWPWLRRVVGRGTKG